MRATGTPEEITMRKILGDRLSETAANELIERNCESESELLENK